VNAHGNDRTGLTGARRHAIADLEIEDAGGSRSTGSSHRLGSTATAVRPGGLPAGGSPATNGRIRMRRAAIVVAFLTALALPALTAAPAAGAAEDRTKIYEAAKKEGEVTLATSGPAEQYSRVLKAFEKKYAGVKANLYRNASAKVIEKFLTERRAGKAIIDVMQMPPPGGRPRTAFMSPTCPRA
jgi:hypothetical protein